MAFITSEERKEKAWRKVEAMYRQGYETDKICKATGLSRLECLDVQQYIFAMDMRREEKERRRAAK